MSAIVIDAFEFARQRERREGAVAVADLSRLTRESQNPSGLLQWTLVGGAGKLGHPQLSLSISTTVTQVCQRCLAPFALDIAAESVLVLARDEAEADRLEEALDSDDIEVIVGGKEMNLLDLIEDEALLALPLSPRHAVCPDLSIVEANQGVKPSPFSVLEVLKK